MISAYHHPNWYIYIYIVVMTLWRYVPNTNNNIDRDKALKRNSSVFAGSDLNHSSNAISQSASQPASESQVNRVKVTRLVYIRVWWGRKTRRADLVYVCCREADWKKVHRFIRCWNVERAIRWKNSLNSDIIAILN